MRAVNLLPPDLRSAAYRPALIARQEPAEGIGAYVLLGVLALCVAALAGYVLVNNGVKQRRADLQSAQQRTAAATAKAAALKPYADFEALANARVETVRGLAASRFGWDQALRDVSHAIPGDVKLTTLSGDLGLPGAAGTAGDPLRGSIQAPAISMTGCASDQRHVARMLARIKAVDGVTRVALSKSEGSSQSSGSATGAACGGKAGAPSFSLVVFFERSASIAALTPSGGKAATSTVPVPNAVSKAGDATSPQASSTPAATTTGGAP